MSQHRKRSKPSTQPGSTELDNSLDQKMKRQNYIDHDSVEVQLKQQEMADNMKEYMQMQSQNATMPNPMFGYPHNAMGMNAPMTSYGGMFNQPQMMNHQMQMNPMNNPMYSMMNQMPPQPQTYGPISYANPAQFGYRFGLQPSSNQPSTNFGQQPNLAYQPHLSPEQRRAEEDKWILKLHGALQCGISNCNQCPVAGYHQLNDLKMHVSENNHYLYCHAPECIVEQRQYLAKPFAYRHGLQEHLWRNTPLVCSLPLLDTGGDLGFRTCSFMFNGYLALVEHIRTAHCTRSVTVKGSQHYREYVCAVCQFVGADPKTKSNERMIIANHVIDKHMVLKPNAKFRCFKCAKEDTSYLNTIACCADKKPNEF